MTKDLFVKSILALKAQFEHDNKISEKLSEVFPNAFEANLLYDNHWLRNSLIENLQIAMNDEFDTQFKQSWIEYFCFDLNFGAENNKLKVFDKNKKEIPMSTPEQLYDFLKNKKKFKKSY